jgi:hypothetical protein
MDSHRGEENAVLSTIDCNKDNSSWLIAFENGTTLSSACSKRSAYGGCDSETDQGVNNTIPYRRRTTIVPKERLVPHGPEDWYGMDDLSESQNSLVRNAVLHPALVPDLQKFHIVTYSFSSSSRYLPALSDAFPVSKNRLLWVE